ncbi:MAG: 5'-nucleotidase C-terminal domain-containing protein [Eggerthellaceae bacterium]|nr:5'-nucleotidase C-terminal domain-containing protein [Eggerthellaceae bacterium]
MSKKKLTILHSNDLHGDFIPKTVDGVETGGIARLSGYVKNARKQADNVVYAMAGDLFRGSIIDSEYLGLSTIDLVNVLDPDIATVGNHEVDYGIAHLLFLEKCATFPIVNADLFITLNNTRLFEPYRVIEVDGIKVMFIGILTDEVIASTKQEAVIGAFVDIEEAAREVGIICDNYRTRKIDLTVLLTHIGIEEDRKLAELLDPHWGIDLIIGGHSHTFMDEPEVVNGIPIVQAGMGTGVVGRFDLVVNTWTNGIESYEWQCVPINEQTAPVDEIMAQMIERYQGETDAKYKRLLTRFARKLTHPSRIEETELGNLYADMLQEDSSFDVMVIGTGSIRKEELGPLVEYQDMLENTPFDDKLWMLKVTGGQFRRMVMHFMRDEAWEGHTEFYQFSKGMRVVYRKSTHTLEEFKLNGQDITDDQVIDIALQNYHFQNFDEFMGVPLAEVEANMKPRVVASSVNNIFEEYFSTHQNLDAHVEGRLVILE